MWIAALRPGLLAAGLLTAVASNAAPPSELLAHYQATGAGPFQAVAGATVWSRAGAPGADGRPRRCASCHGERLDQPGRNVSTGKTIEPLSPRVNPQRLTAAAEIEKWFTRNCKWTFGRECSAQEKGDLLTWLATQ
jgi:hypothetical protein